ncbi:hypothetical protein [Latilactobacillus sakei]|uniref:hypothetical protein n=1 Tax=Latilactobacillus sakei TaxID=1599 RepID=UPI003F53D5D9
MRKRQVILLSVATLFSLRALLTGISIYSEAQDEYKKTTGYRYGSPKVGQTKARIASYEKLNDELYTLSATQEKIKVPLDTSDEYITLFHIRNKLANVVGSGNEGSLDVVEQRRSQEASNNNNTSGLNISPGMSALLKGAMDSQARQANGDSSSDSSTDNDTSQSDSHRGGLVAVPDEDEDPKV